MNASGKQGRTEVAVLGAGKLGAAMAMLLSRAGRRVALWARREEQARAVAGAMPGVSVVTSIEDACRDARVVCFAVPTQALREVARGAGEVARGDQIALHACRGVERGFTLAHDVIRQETCIKKIGALGGPLYLDDAERGRPLVAVLASRFDEVQRIVKALTASTPVRIHSTRDVIGVEVCGAISNVSHIGAGMAAGVGLGETDQGILLTRGLVEATRIGVALGAARATFSGLAGVGDLIPRPVRSTRRHRRLGEEIGGGVDAGGARAAAEDLEGLMTMREAQAVGERHGLSLPLIDALNEVLFHGRSPASTLEHVLAMDLDLDVPEPPSAPRAA
jgi:glycerol-3-phosphate dehydrogenase (NAD(P)+)